MPHRHFVCLLVFALTPAWARAAVNLVANPGFAVDYSHWQLSGAPVNYEWSPVDEAGKLNSGSVRLSAIQPNLTSGFYSDCFPVTPGAALVYGGSFSAADGQTGSPRIRLALYEDSMCGGTYRDDSDDLRVFTRDSIATWGPIQGYTSATADEISGRLFVSFWSDDEPPSEVRFDNFFVYEGATCAAGPGVTCLGGGRFRVDVDWHIPDGTRGHGRMRALTSETAVATFFGPENIEVLVKVLNACAVNDRYWVFAAGLSNVEYTLTVTDTQTGKAWSFDNPMNQPAPPVQDTSTFDVCPH